MLTIIKSLNNNIVLAKADTSNEELVLFGKGIGFKKQKGDRIDLTDASKVFYLKESAHSKELLDHIQPEILAITEKIVSHGETILQTKINSSILLSLADHLQFAIERDDDLIKDNPLQWEIPHLYRKEYEAGKVAIQLIQKELGRTLPAMEASFIALHFVNAQTENPSMEDTLQMVRLNKHIITIIENLFDTKIDTSTITYSRFITHLRYFVARQMTHKQATGQMDEQFREIIQERYMKSYACALMIKDMVQREFNWQLTDDEITYLVIHIERLIKENQT